MPITTCRTCGHDYSWGWPHAFDKFGFDDGDGQVMTETVADILRDAGYAVTTESWGMHNVIITSIKCNGTELIPATADLGYDHPRAFLPAHIVALLDASLPDDAEMPA